MTWRGYSAFVGSAARVMRAECSRSSTVGLFGQSWWVFSKTQGQSANLSHSQYLVLSTLPARAKREEKKRILKERAFSEMLVKLSTRYSRSPPAGEQEPRAGRAWPTVHRTTPRFQSQTTSQTTTWLAVHPHPCPHAQRCSSPRRLSIRLVRALRTRGRNFVSEW